LGGGITVAASSGRGTIQMGDAYVIAVEKDLFD